MEGNIQENSKLPINNPEHEQPEITKTVVSIEESSSKDWAYYPCFNPFLPIINIGPKWNFPL